MHRITLSLILLFLNLNLLQAQTGWKLTSNKENIKIYTGTMADSKVNAVKVECSLQAKPAQIVALIMDVESAPNWIYHTKSCKILKRVSPSELYYYSEVSVPWPAENRDFVAHLTVTQHAKTGVVSIDGPAVSGMVPTKKGVVRINNSKGKWIITPTANGQSLVEYTLHADPGGAIPGWLVNMFATEGPYQIFKQLKVQLEKPEYKHAQLAYIKD
jgi:ribosome-associated toxin RatA of RatAB toxin-antitoxin module